MAEFANNISVGARSWYSLAGSDDLSVLRSTDGSTKFNKVLPPIDAREFSVSIFRAIVLSMDPTEVSSEPFLAKVRGVL